MTIFVELNLNKMNIRLYCPKCNHRLVKGESKEFETLCEHVENPNKLNYPLRPTWECKNNMCPASKEDIFWSEDGEMYGWNRNFEFDNDLHSAYPSIARRLDIEIYKKGLRKEIYLPAFLMLWVLKPMIELNYKADDYGEVLEKSWELKWLKKDCWYKKDRFGYHTFYTFPLVLIYNGLKSNHDTFKNCSDGYIEYQLKTMFNPISSWDKRWWRHFELWLSKIIFRKYYLKSLKK